MSIKLSQCWVVFPRCPLDVLLPHGVMYFCHSSVHYTQLFPIIIVPVCSVLVLLEMCIFPVCVSMCTESLFHVSTFEVCFQVCLCFVFTCFGLLCWILTLACLTTRFGLPFNKLLLLDICDLCS